MSSKEQLKRALILTGQIIHKQKNEIEGQKKTIQRQAGQIRGLKNLLDNKSPWWQFWK